jgi:hypothetical protein
MSAIQRKSTKKEQQSDSSEVQVQVQEVIEIPLPQPKKKEKGSSKQEAAPIEVYDNSTPSVVVEEPKASKKEKGSSKQKEQKDSNQNVVDDDSTLSVAVAEPKPSKKGKSSAPKPEEPIESNSVEPAPSKKGKGKQSVSQTETSENDESGVESETIEKSKKQPPKPLGEQMTDSVETLKENVEKSKVLIELKDTLQKQISALISSRKKELKKLKLDDESEDLTLQFLEKQKECLKNEISELKSSIRDLSSISKVIEKATKQLESKRNKSDPSKPKKERAKILVPVSTKGMNNFIEKNYTLKTNDGSQIFEQKPEKNSDGNFLVERTKLMQLIHAYIREKSLRNTYPEDKGRILLNDELKPLFSTYLDGDLDKRVDSTSIFSVLSNHLEKKA